MTLRWLCLLSLMIFAAPLIADDQPTEPAAPPATPPAAANATAEVPAQPQAAPTPSPPPPQTDSSAESAKTTPAILAQRVDALLKDPGPMIDRAAVQSQLDDLTLNAFELSNVAADPQARFDAMNLQLQSLYTRLVEYPDADDVDHLLGRLRAAARRIKTIDLAAGKTSGGGVGDFWLMTAELYDMNRTKLPLAARRKQAAGLMKDFLSKHPDWPAAMDVREALEQLEKKPAKATDDATPTQGKSPE